ncbi:hypothetical protein KY290_020326 [Solanum tuberosum]|uniref:NB-ARC domain-containing protein n=1 Tax=Solanum tuberosum TaxID=4113 RepID=A0ABQ7V0B0_SOLTU|nr:hypothetical protein KY290_020326 [Solanum tuberosum]
MAAYTAVISLLQTLDQPNISELFHDHSTEMLDSLRATAEYFQDVLENTSNEKIKSFEEDVRVVVNEAEDVVEMKISEIIKEESWTLQTLQHQDMLPVVEKMDTTKKQVMEILSVHDADQIPALSGDSLIGSTYSMSDPMLSDQLKDDIVQGLDDDLEIIDKRLRGPTSYLDIVTISGMGGIGKTTLAKKAYDHLPISHPNKCLGVLGLSYHHLPNRLKPCFLSLGDFPEDFQVDTWRLIQLWIAEGFIRTSTGSRESLEEVAEHYLEDLISRNLIMARKKRFNGEVKACGIHDLLREFCLIEAEMTKFMHVVRTPLSPAQKPNFRRFSIQEYIKDAYKLLPRVARSIHCFSYLGLPYEPRIKLLPILPIYRHDPIIHGFFSCFNHLRVLAIFPALFGSFPLVITKLFHLRYLQVGCFENIPESISELLNLQTLICDYCSLDATLPRKIWMLKNLRYIRLAGATYLPSPRIDNNLVTGMPNLEELYGISYPSCTNEVISSTPNLKRLIIRVYYSTLNNIPDRPLDMSSLTKLETFKFYWDYLEGPIKIFVFPKSLRRVSLTRCNKFIWEEISSTFIMLPHLEELILKCCRAKDDVWRLTDKDIFRSLKLLLLRALNLKGWEASSDNFPNLKRLVLKNCQDLQEIPTDFGEICTLESIELHECCITAEDSARNIEQEQEDMGNNILKVYIHNSHRN